MPAMRTHDVERVRDPEAHEIPRAPLATLWFNRLQIMVVQHELSICQSRLTLYRQLVHKVGNLGRFDLLHYEIEKARFVR